MNSAVGLSVFALGVVLLISGLDESHSMSSELSRLFTGSPSDKAVWMVSGGALAVASGLCMALRARPH